MKTHLFKTVIVFSLFLSTVMSDLVQAEPPRDGLKIPVSPELIKAASAKLGAKVFCIPTEMPGLLDLKDNKGQLLAQMVIDTFGPKNQRIGFAGHVEVAALLQNDKIIGIIIGKNSDTPRYVQRIQKGHFLDSWNGLTLEQANKKKVDVISGATMTSGAVIHSVRMLDAKSINATPETIQQYRDVERALLEKREKQVKDRLTTMLKQNQQYQEKRDQEMKLRRMAAMESNDAANKYARENRLVELGRFVPSEGVKKCVVAYKTNATDANKKALDDEIDKGIEQSAAALEAKIKEFKRSSNGIQKQLQLMNGK